MRGFELSRRRFAGLAATSALAMPYVSTTALGAASGEIIMANFGGGPAASFRNAYGLPFQEETGIKFRVIEVPSTETALISSASAPQYNSSYHSFAGAMRLYKMGITEAIAIDDYPELANIPEKFLPRIDDKHLVGLPVHFGFYGMCYNRDFAKAEELKSWNALISPKFKQRVSATRPTFASLYDVPWYSYMLTGDQKKLDAGIAQYRKVIANSVTAYTSMAQNNQLLERGEAVASAYYASTVWTKKREGINNVDVLIPEEGALMLPYVLVIPKNCPWPEAARKFLAYASTPAPAERALEGTGSLPFNTKAKVDDAMIKARFNYTLPDLVKQLYSPDWAFVEATRLDLIKRLEAEVLMPQ
ncbi:MAG: extracellular solute-binding protein [Acetobacteraceae bacterium]